MIGRREVRTNILWLLGERILRIAVNFGVIGLLARHLGPDAFGALNYAAGIAALFTALATVGLDTVVVRDLVRTPAATPTILGTAFVLRLCGSLVAIALVVTTAPLFIDGRAELRPLLWIASLGLAWQAFDVIDLWFQKNLQSRHTVGAKLVALLAGSALKVWLVQREAGLRWFCWALVADGFFYAIALSAVYRREGGRMTSWSWSAQLARALLRVSWPLITAGLLISLYLRLDQILVLRVLGERQLGYYSAAVKVSDLWIALSAFVLTSVFPLLAARRREGPGPFERDLQFAFDVMTGFGYVIAVVVTIAAPRLIPLIFGETYRPAGNVLAVLAWAAPFMFSGGIRAHYFMLEGTTVYHNWAAALGIVANVGLAVWLMPALGAPGAALAVTLSAALSAWLTSYFFPRLHHCAKLQTKAFLLPFRPRTWPGLWRRLA